MTRTGMSPRLGQHLPEPFVEIHPDDAQQFGVARWRLRARHHRLRPMHPARSWSASGSSAACCSRRSTGAARTPPPRASARWWRRSPIRSPASPRTRRRRSSITPYEYVFRGFALSRTQLELPDACLVGARRGHRRLWLSARRQCRSRGLAVLAASRSRATISPNTRISAAASIARRRLPATASRPACSSARRAMPATGTWSRACSRRTRSPTISAACCCRANRWTALANAGPIVCACFGVGRNTICDAIAAGASTAAEIGAQAQGRHQLRLLHSGTEAPDRADAGGRRPAAKSHGGELRRRRATRWLIGCAIAAGD